MGLTDVKQVGPVYDFGISSPTYGLFGGFIKPNTFVKELQTQLRDEVIAALTIAIGDRDLEFWKRQSQFDWSQGDGQVYFSNPSRYDFAHSLDVHTPGQVRLVPQPTQLLAAAGNAINGRGSAVCQRKAFFPWKSGFYCWSDAATGGTVSTATTPGGFIGDIVTDGTNLFFAIPAAAKAWTTTGAAPGALTAYDTSGAFYGRLTYDQLKKILYGVDGAVSGLARFVKVNAGAGHTLIYDFVTGRLDALEMHQGNVIIGWNGALNINPSVAGAYVSAKIFKYDGTNVLPFVDFPDGTFITGLKSANGTLYAEIDEADPLDKSNFPATVHAVYAINGSVVTRLGVVDGFMVGGDTSGVMPYGSPTAAVQVGQHVFFPGTGHVTRYDTLLGGFSRSLGDDGVPGLVNTFSQATMGSLAFLSGIGLLCVYGGGATTGGVYNLHGSIFGIVPSSAGVGTCKLTGSRMDGSLPYVQKFWYAWEGIFSALLANESVEMEYSIDDGATWVACGGSPANTVGQTQKTFLIQQRNPHARYRVKLLPNGGVTAGPILLSVSGRYAVLNPNASVYRMTISCVDSIRARGNQIDQPGYGKDALAYLDNIARANELVTFYEPDDSTRTPHTCWVWTLKRPMPNTSSDYKPNKQEGDVDLVLWEVV